MSIYVSSVDAQSFCQLLDIFETFTSVGLILPWCSSSSAATFPDMHKLVHSFVILLEDLSVIHFFLGMRGVEWERLSSLFKLLVADLLVATALEL